MRDALFAVTMVAMLFFGTDVFAQAGSVYNVAGGGSLTADGMPATSSYIYSATGVATDASGNIYSADRSLFLVRRIDAGTGLIYTVAGTGSLGIAGDGGPATSAPLSSNIRGLWVDGYGNLFISDNDRIRRVDGGSGIITTVAGGGSSMSDGVPATTAALNPQSVYVDNAGNIYTGSSDGRVRKIGPSGIITTVAGGGGSTAEGVPATSASLSGSAKSICMDNAGNLYIIDFDGNKVRKVSATTGLINTVAGGGSSVAEGIPATSASFIGMTACAVDGGGNMFIADWSRNLIRRVDASTGIINTIAGTTSGSSADGTPALSADVRPYMIRVDPVSGNVYYSDFNAHVKRFSYSSLVPFTGSGGLPGPGSDSFYVSIYKQCSGPQLSMRTRSYHPGMTVKTWYGDATSDVASVSSAYSGIGGYVLFNHIYGSTGTYTIKHVLYSGSTPIDSFTHSYNHVYCTSVPVKFYFDGNGNCTKETTEPYLSKTVKTEIDSNGFPVDTIMATNGFNYTAYGNPGDTYTFKIISLPTDNVPSCPSSGINTQVLPAASSSPVNWFAINCSSSPSIDLSVNGWVPVTGPHDQWGHIYVRNTTCHPADGIVSLSFSPKYIYTSGAHPTPSSISGNTLTWDVSALSANGVGLSDIYYQIWDNPVTGYLIGNDTVHEHFLVSAVTGGDTDTSNNNGTRQDTVKTSCDPNLIEVAPALCFNADTTFTFSVHFENTGNDTADNIYVLDTLSDLLDPSTLQVQLNSHPMFISRWQAGWHTVFRFDFPNIKLPDSSHYGLCDGLFIYKIRNKPGVLPGAAIKSKVGIYFDYNDVVMTNTVQNTKGCPSPATAINAMDALQGRATLFPNPATDELTIKTAGSYSTLTVSNSMGRAVMQQSLQNAQTIVNVKSLPPGLYLVILQGEGGREVVKFVKK